MRVLAVTPWFPSDSRPGLGLFNVRDVELLAQDHDVTVLHLHDPALGGDYGESALANGVSVKRIPYHTSRPWTVPQAALKLRRLMSEMDLVHTMAFPALLPTHLSGVRVPWVHTEHWSALVVRPDTVRARVGQRALRGGLRRPDNVVAVGSALADVVGAIRKDGVPVIGNFVRFGPQNALATEPDLKSGTPLRLVAVGGVVSRKGPLETVEALAHLRSWGIDARLSWAGVGPLEDRVRRRAAELNVTHHVELLGHLPPERLSSFLSGGHVFVMPTAGETFGVAFAEALAHGLPVVASGVGGHLEFLPPEASRVATRSPDVLASAVLNLAEDPQRWSAMQIREFARQQFSEHVRREQYAEMYRRAIENHYG